MVMIKSVFQDHRGMNKNIDKICSIHFIKIFSPVYSNGKKLVEYFIQNIIIIGIRTQDNISRERFT